MMTGISTAWKPKGKITEMILEEEETNDEQRGGTTVDEAVGGDKVMEAWMDGLHGS